MNRIVGFAIFLFIVVIIVVSSLVILSAINDARSGEVDEGYRLILSFNDFLIIGVTVAVVFVLVGAALSILRKDGY